MSVTCLTMSDATQSCQIRWKKETFAKKKNSIENNIK